MDHTKTKTFIAFTNKVGKDKFWITGSWLRDEDGPQVFPYETKEQKESANLTAFRNTGMDDCGEIEGVIFNVSSQVVKLISKDKAAEIEMKNFGNTMYDNTKPKKKKSEKIEEVKPIVEEKKVEKVEVAKPISTEQPKKRGRPPKMLSLLEN